MNSITAAALGAGMMYLLDPEQGSTRRGKIQEKFQGLVEQTKGEFDLSLHDLQSRAESCARDVRTSFAEGAPIEGLQAVKQELTQWTPATRLLAAAGGGALAAYMLGRIAPKTMVLAGLGAGVCAAIANSEKLQAVVRDSISELEASVQQQSQRAPHLDDEAEELPLRAWEQPARAEQE